MPETSFSFSQLESPAPGATLPAGQHTLRGWVWPRPGGHFVDVRARIGDRLFPGVHGLPRADLAAHFQTGRAVALAEFHVVVEFAPGSMDVALEVLEIGGRWITFQSVTYKVTLIENPPHEGETSGPLRWIDYAHGLRQLLRDVAGQPGQSPSRLAAQLVSELPYPRIIRHAPAPLIGFVDEPATVCCCRFGRIPAFGHLFHPALRLRRILATVDLQSWQPLAVHQPSPGPAAYYSQHGHAQACGFIGLVDVPAQLPNPVSLRIYAELEDGSLHLGPVVRTRLHTGEEDKRSIRVSSPRTFESVQSAWDEALALQKMAVHMDAELQRALAQLRAEHGQPRPTRRSEYLESNLRILGSKPLMTGATLPARNVAASANEPTNHGSLALAATLQPNRSHSNRLTVHDKLQGIGPIANEPVASLVDTPWQTKAPLPRRVLLATHGLSRQGAPRFLLEYGRALAAAGATLHVVSAEEGPLRSEFAAMGAKVTIVDAAAVLQADSAAAASQAPAGLLRQTDWADVDLVVANSFTTFWAVHAAKAAGRPTLMYVHESTTPAAFFGQRVPPAVIALVEEAFGLADAVSFTTASTRRYHLDYGRPERHRLTPGWMDVAALDRWMAQQDRAELRRDFGLQPGEQLVCNIGTVSDRKGQHTFARAVDLLWRRYPAIAARTKFILLGGRDTPFDTMLGEALAELGRDNIIVHPETSDYLRYYLAADIMACSSYEESSPLVVFEAMACRTPILASAVHGVPELVRPDLEACLLPAGDTVAWCEGLARMLAAPQAGRELAARGRARLESRFAAPLVLPQHLALASIVASSAC